MNYKIVAAKKFKYELDGEKIIFLPGDEFPFTGTRGQRGMLQRGELTVEMVEELPIADIDYDTFTVAELREMASEHGMSYSGLNKAELIGALKEAG